MVRGIPAAMAGRPSRSAGGETENTTHHALRTLYIAHSALRTPHPMKILLLTWDFPPTRGGIQVWMAELARRLPDATVRVLAPAVRGDRASDRALGLDVRRLGAARFGRFAWIVELTLRTIVACFSWRPDLVVCGHVITAPAALVARRLSRVPYAVFVYGYEIRGRRWRSWITHLLRRSNLVVACSEFTSREALKLGVPSSRMRVLYPGVD